MLTRTSFYNLRFEDEIAIGAPPEPGFAFFEAMKENYTRWHRDHIAFEWPRWVRTCSSRRHHDHLKAANPPSVILGLDPRIHGQGTHWFNTR